MKTQIVLTAFFFTASLLGGCSASASKEDQHKKASVVDSNINVPVFNADSAYQYIAQQVAFGPRVPNTSAHESCGAFLAGELRRHGATVIEQKAVVTAYDGTALRATNIIGSFQPQNKTRLLLFAHWDTRPWADNDPDESKHHTPILGANDGASGVAMLLEMARLIQEQQPQVGIDLIFFDCEDYGTPQWAGQDSEDSWCLGTQYWASTPHVEGYNARYGILLDMVGGRNATFYQERFSKEYAQSTIDKVWNTASTLGFGSYFPMEEGGSITDDHLYVNRIAGIPSIDIIPMDKLNGGFGYSWHTLQDDMSCINKATLKAVGQTLTTVIYNEKK